VTADHYPSVTIVAGDLHPSTGPTGTFGIMLRMHDGATYIHITPKTAAQWVGVLSKIAEGNN
jgi:hypothetical protein